VGGAKPYSRVLRQIYVLPGDVGFNFPTSKGELFVLGRFDLVMSFINFDGHIFYPNLLESALNMSVNALRKGSTTVYLDELTGQLTLAIEPSNRSARQILYSATVLQGLAEEVHKTIATLFSNFTFFLPIVSAQDEQWKASANPNWSWHLQRRDTSSCD
jgi:hypothetical protein